MAYNDDNRNGSKKKYSRSGYAAFYTGVGYGKASHGEKHLGFNSDDDRKSFERGTERHKKYFMTHSKETKPKGFFARIAAWFKG